MVGLRAFPSKEGREAAREDDGGTSYRVSRNASSIVQERDIDYSLKGTAPRIISSSFSSDDSDDRVKRGGRHIGGGNEDSEDTN